MVLLQEALLQVLALAEVTGDRGALAFDLTPVEVRQVLKYQNTAIKQGIFSPIKRRI